MAMRARRLVGWALVVAFAAGSILTGLILHKRAIDDFERSQDNLAARAASQAQAAANTSVGQLTSEASLFEASDVVTSKEFRVFTRPVLEDGTISATAFAPQVADSRRRAFEANRNLRILERGPGGLRPASRRPSYYPVTYTALAKPSDENPRGLDLASDPRQLAALTRAQDHGDAAATNIGDLVVTGGRGIVVYQPIYGSGQPRDTTLSRRRALQGFAVAVFQGSDIANAALAGTPADTTAQFVENGIPVLGSTATLDDASSATVRIADRAWTLVVVDPNRPAAIPSLLVGGIGLLLAAMLAGLLVTWSRRERYALAMVDARIAERDAAEEERRHADEQYKLLAENASDVITVQDMSGKILYVSPSCEALFGWPPEELIGAPGIEHVHPDDAEASNALLLGLRAGREAVTHQYRYRRKDGRYVWVETAFHSLSGPDGDRPTEIQGATRDIAERKAMEEELARLAHEDPLTGLTNRRRFEEELDAELARTRRTAGSGAVLLIDLDRFKTVNDTHGHATGDTLLAGIAALLLERLRESDVVGRLGGDEFAALLPATDGRDARLAAEAIVKAIREHRRLGPGLGAVTASVGIALFGPDPRMTSETVIAEADIAMYRAKEDGRDRVRAYDMARDTSEGRASRPGLRDS